MTGMTRTQQRGAINVWLILSIAFGVTTIVAAAFFVWAYGNYQDQKNNVDTKVSIAVAAAQKEQADLDEAKFLEREKEPNRQFVGPDDYGRLLFDYPKTWSMYVTQEASSGGRYEAYLNPISVPTINSSTQFALRVDIETKSYDSVVQSYNSKVKSGDLVATAVQADEVTGTRFDGTFSSNIRGAAVVFKIRDKTVTLRTDADTFKPDFDALIKTITFDK
jgi:hypothetical protein